MARRPSPRQITLQVTKDRISEITSQRVEERLDDIAYYATHTALTGGGRGDGVDTGAYVISFSMGPAGFGGGRSRTSKGKPRNQSPSQKKQEGYDQLKSDIAGMNLKQMIEDGNARVTLRNRAPHAEDVEYGDSWKSPGYGVFGKIRSKFR